MLSLLAEAVQVLVVLLVTVQALAEVVQGDFVLLSQVNHQEAEAVLKLPYQPPLKVTR